MRFVNSWRQPLLKEGKSGLGERKDEEESAVATIATVATAETVGTVFLYKKSCRSWSVLWIEQLMRSEA